MISKALPLLKSNRTVQEQKSLFNFIQLQQYKRNFGFDTGDLRYDSMVHRIIRNRK